MRVQLLRHGETEGGARYWGATDVALSASGWRQMLAAVDGRAWDLIVSSPMRRCSAFAEPLARDLNVPCRLETDLREMCFGAWDGRSVAELMESDAEALCLFWTDPSAHTPPGAESLAQLQLRVMAAWRRAVTEGARRRLLIVTHGGPIRLLRAAQSAIALSGLLSIDVPHGAMVDVECADDGSVVPFRPLSHRPGMESG
jgi:alpha-ribazole phosphatase